MIWMLAILLSVLSLLTVYSSTGSLAWLQRGGDTEYYLIKQFMVVVFGLAIMYIAYLIPFRYYSRIGQFLFYISIPLLLATLVYAPEINNASRYLEFDVPLAGTLSFQTSDLAKLALIMFLARFLSKKQDDIKSFKKGFVIVMIPIIIVCGLILPANLSTAAMLFVVSMILLFIGRVSMKHLGLLALTGITVFGIMWGINKYNPEVLPRVNTWMSRLESFFDKDKEPSYQVVQSKIAVATGGLTGKMPGNSTQRNFLPHSYSDFVYAIIIEEYGLIGGTVIMLMFMILLFRSMKIARKCKVLFGSYLVTGISFLMVFQALINMGVAVSILPVTGQTLPFISMGGTSFWFSCLGLGMILSVSKSVEEPETEKPKNLSYATA